MATKHRLSRREIAARLDATILKPNATETEVRRLAETAAGEKMRAVCVQPAYVPLVAEIVNGSPTMVCTVNDFPHGAGGVRSKVDQALASVEAGAQEIDTVAPLGLIAAGAYERAAEEVAELATAVEVPVKVILETALWAPEQIAAAAEKMVDTGVAFLKTSTGFNGSGATIGAVEILRRAATDPVGVKASGGIRDYEQAMEMIAAGADVIGTSSPLALYPDEDRN